jgi:hypothetical protein
VAAAGAVRLPSRLLLVDHTVAFEDDSGERVFGWSLDEIKAALPALWPGVILSLADREYRVLFSNPYLCEGSVRSVEVLKEPWRQAFHGSTPKPVEPVGQ